MKTSQIKNAVNTPNLRNHRLAQPNLDMLSTQHPKNTVRCRLSVVCPQAHGPDRKPQLADVAQHHAKKAPSCASLDRKTVKFPSMKYSRVLLNVHNVCTSVKSKYLKLNHPKSGTICTCFEFQLAVYTLVIPHQEGVRTFRATGSY